MQRVSALLPSWDKRASSSADNSSSNSSSSSNSNSNSNSNPNPGSGTATNKTASGGGFFGWSNRSSTASARTSVFNGLSKINVNSANNRNSSTGSIANGRIQREAFWPANLDIECEKAARIIKSFCADGYLAPVDGSATAHSDEPKTPVKVPKKIPKRIIQNAAGIAVFTCMRSGLWMTGSGGSGILIARKSDGTWSPPSGIMLHTPTLSFIIGVDVYDCVLVINSLAALESITQPRVTLGEDVGLTSGPLVPMDSPGTEIQINIRELGNTVLTYMKSRGQEQLVNLNGCILTERANENERFYESSVTQMDILSGNVSRHVEETRPLSEVIKLAEGRTDFDPTVVGKIAAEPAPGDANIASPHSTPLSPRRTFGVPQADDPDPFGVLALEMAGMEIREAGTRLRPVSSQMDFHARSASRPPSSALSKTYRQSGDTFVTRSNRESCMSSRTVKSQMTDAYTQTDTGNTPETSPSPSRSENGQEEASFGKIPERKHDEVEDDDEIDYTTIDLTPLKHLSHPYTSREAWATDRATTAENQDTTKVATPTTNDKAEGESKGSSHHTEVEKEKGKEKEGDDDDDGALSNDDADDEDDDDEEPVVFEVAAVQRTSTQAVASRMIQAKGNMVTIPKRIPPPLPTRNPARSSLINKGRMSDEGSSSHDSLHQEPGDSDHDAEADEQKRDSTTPQPADVAADRSRSPSPSAEAPSKADTPEAKDTEFETTPREEKAQPVETKTEEIRAPEPQVEDAKKEEPSLFTEESESKSEDSKVDEVKVEEPNVEESKVSESETEERKPEDLKTKEKNTKEPKCESSETEELNAGGRKSGESKTEVPEVEESKEDEAKGVETKGEALKEDEADTATALDEADDIWESNKKNGSSIDTGATDVRSSFAESSYTTPPTSERRFSLKDDEGETTKEPLKDDEKPVTEEKGEVKEKHQTGDGEDAAAPKGVTAA